MVHVLYLLILYFTSLLRFYYLIKRNVEEITSFLRPTDTAAGTDKLSSTRALLWIQSRSSEF